MATKEFYAYMAHRLIDGDTDMLDELIENLIDDCYISVDQEWIGPSHEEDDYSDVVALPRGRH